jgi:hypothetical protein
MVVGCHIFIPAKAQNAEVFETRAEAQQSGLVEESIGTVDNHNNEHYNDSSIMIITNHSLLKQGHFNETETIRHY